MGDNPLMKLLVSTLAGVLGGILVGTFGGPGLIVLTGVLGMSVLLRSVGLAVASAVAGLTALVVWGLAAARCQPTLGRNCDLAGGEGTMLAWAAAIALGGAIVIWVTIRRRGRDPQHR